MRDEIRQRTVTVGLNGGMRLIVRKAVGAPVEIILHEEHELGTKTVLTNEESDDMVWLFKQDTVKPLLVHNIDRVEDNARKLVGTIAETMRVYTEAGMPKDVYEQSCSMDFQGEEPYHVTITVRNTR